eukprot:CAMPEP_0119408350 /NCGR_PEP_ID=MMETSP1335-20130426/1930_1 /TAXON_ID=259385 /ORGANISM="Chrysoculter rhomboideus, Strain RCC1486" /LENGTH=97 /DNA_ID=CAMNT_0007432575 /DNA_START=14 /DNA_END=307 /DNA_ORIENTATION=-
MAVATRGTNETPKPAELMSAPRSLGRPIFILGLTMITLGAIMFFLAIDDAWREQPGKAFLDVVPIAMGRNHVISASMFVCTAAIIWAIQMAAHQDDL